MFRKDVYKRQRKSLFKFMLELSDEDIAALDRLMKKAIEFTQNNKEKD